MRTVDRTTEDSRTRHAWFIPQSAAQGASAIRRTVSAMEREWRLRRDIRQLRGAPDAILKDIGIDRSEIEGVVRMGRAAYRAR